MHTAEFTRRLAAVRVLVIGDVMLDEQIVGRIDRISPEAPVPVIEIATTHAMPGGAANVACNVAALGGQVCLAGVRGDDAQGVALTAALERRRIDCGLMLVDRGRPTTTKTRIIAQHQQVLRMDHEDRQEIGPELDEALRRAVSDRLASVDAVILSDYLKGVLTFALTAHVIRECTRRGLPVIVDPKGRLFAKYAGATVITPNLAESYAAIGADSSRPSAAEAAERLAALLPRTAVLVTCGEDGMTLLEPGRQAVHIAATARSVFDVTGAGDTAVAVLGTCLAAGEPLERAARIANFGAGLAVEKFGTATLTVEELAAFLQERGTAQTSVPRRRASDRAPLPVAWPGGIQPGRTVSAGPVE